MRVLPLVWSVSAPIPTASRPASTAPQTASKRSFRASSSAGPSGISFGTGARLLLLLLLLLLLFDLARLELVVSAIMTTFISSRLSDPYPNFIG